MGQSRSKKGGSRRPFAHVTIEVRSADQKAQLEALEDSLSDRGVEFDTGWDVESSSRDWELDESLSGPLGPRAIINMLRRARFDIAVTWKPRATKKSKKTACREGDIVRIGLDDHGNRGYGRIIKSDRGVIFVEFFKVVGKEDPPLEAFKTFDSILKIYTTDVGIQDHTWTLIGNMPIPEDFEMPRYWWSRDPLTKELQLFTHHLADWRTGEKTTEENILRLRAQPDGVFGHVAAQLTLARELRKTGTLMGQE